MSNRSLGGLRFQQMHGTAENETEEEFFHDEFIRWVGVDFIGQLSCI
jgi:hypothetical protein